MSSLPARANVVSSGPASSATASPTTWRARLAGHRAARQGDPAEPRWLDRSRLELHLPDRPLEGDDGGHARLRWPSTRSSACSRRAAASRSRARPSGMQELTRRMASSRSWGIESELIDPAGAKELVPYLDERHPRRLPYPGRRRRGLAAGRHDHARARGRMGALTISAATEVRGSTSSTAGSPRAHRQGRHRGLDRGHRLRRVEPAHRAHGRGVDPAQPGGPPDDQRRAGAACSPTRSARSSYPIVRDMDTNMYERQHGGDLEVGSYAHRAILDGARRHPVDRRGGAVSDRAAVHQGRLRAPDGAGPGALPDILGDERVGNQHAINGLLSLTPDGMPILGETSDVKGLWSGPRCGSRRAQASRASSPNG